MAGGRWSAAPVPTAADAVVVDPAGWGDRDRERPQVVDTLQDAVVRRRKVSLEYEGRDRRRSRRLVDPWGLVDKDDVWYLVAGTEGGQRTFRVDRMVTVTVTGEVAQRPEGFALSREWERVVDEVEQRRSLLSATVLVAARLSPILRDRFGRHADELGIDDDGRARVRVAAPTPVSVAQELAGWGDAVEVLEPDSVTAELARLGAELVARYATG